MRILVYYEIFKLNIAIRRSSLRVAPLLFLYASLLYVYFSSAFVGYAAAVSARASLPRDECGDCLWLNFWPFRLKVVTLSAQSNIM